jgi:hypothetical protein
MADDSVEAIEKPILEKKEDENVAETPLESRNQLGDIVWDSAHCLGCQNSHPSQLKHECLGYGSLMYDNGYR